MPYQLVATDIDGTITDPSGRVHLKALEVIRELEEKGIPVILVSGRPLPYVESLSLYMGTSGPLIAENGAVLKFGRQLILAGEAELAKKALALLERDFSRAGARLTLDEDNRYRMVDVTLEKTVDPELIRHRLDQAGLPVTLLVTNVMLHLVDAKVSKGKAVLQALEFLGIAPSRAVVCGDSFNDLPLFAIGALNLAVGSAEPSLKQKADRVASLPGGAGFAELVRETFGL
ncbi:MAG TPA: phosphoglycolate phosphatase [Bacillota bacterium]